MTVLDRTNFAQGNAFENAVADQSAQIIDLCRYKQLPLSLQVAPPGAERYSVCAGGGGSAALSSGIVAVAAPRQLLMCALRERGAVDQRLYY